ncbi:MAG TPA: hypothetical protein VIN77_01720 [Aurantimonas sp.]
MTDRDDLSPNGADAAQDQGRLEALVRADYERCRPDDSFEDLKRRARFSKEDKGLLRDWLALAEQRANAG